MKYKNTKVIAFDADDTLWVNETYFREAEEKFIRLMSTYETPDRLEQELFKTEMKNLRIYGYGIKGFMLSMIESALELSNYKLDPKSLYKILDIGKEMFDKPIELLSGVKQTLEALKPKYRLILATKGDLLDQERKLEKSGLAKYFHHIEILSDKKVNNYQNLIKHLDIENKDFLMIGNSLKSDILPVIELGAKAIHVPFHTTWAHEVVDVKEDQVDYRRVAKLTEILKFL